MSVVAGLLKKKKEARIRLFSVAFAASMSIASSTQANRSNGMASSSRNPDSIFVMFFFSSRRRHTRLQGDWSSDVCSSDLLRLGDSAEERTPELFVRGA